MKNTKIVLKKSNADGGLRAESMSVEDRTSLRNRILGLQKLKERATGYKGRGSASEKVGERFRSGGRGDSNPLTRSYITELKSRVYPGICLAGPRLCLIPWRKEAIGRVISLRKQQDIIMLKRSGRGRNPRTSSQTRGLDFCPGYMI